MGVAAQVRAFSGADVRLIARDRFLWGMFGFLVVIALALRFAVPWVVDVVAESRIELMSRVTSHVTNHLGPAGSR